MPRTAPAPDIPPIPGMCPSIAVLAGGGDGGGGSGDSAGDGDGKTSADASSGGEDAQDDSRDAAKGAPDYQKYPECGYASHPVDVVTGRAFTHPITDVALPGPLPLEFRRMYSSKMVDRDAGLGFGWGHTFGWEIEVGRRHVTVWNEQGIAVEFPLLVVGATTIGPWGWVLRRDTWGYAVDADDGVWHIFSHSTNGRRFRLTAIEDRNRNRIALTYEDERLVEVVDSAGRILRVKSTPEGHIASIEVQNAVEQGQWVPFARYAYDKAGNLVSVADADGFAASYTYDADHRLTEDVDRAGLAFHFVYDGKGRCIESWGDYPGRRDPSLAEDLPALLADGITRAKGIHHCRFDYLPDGYTEVADSREVRRFFGNKHGTLDKAVELGGGVVTCTYDDRGHIQSRTDEVGAKTEWVRDPRGRVVKATDPLGRVTTVERDANGLPVKVVDAGGGITTITRDRFGNELTVTDPMGGVTSYAYDARGLETEIISPTGARTRYEYDAQGNTTSLVQSNGGVWRWTFDALGRCVSETNPFGTTTRLAYSLRGDLVSIHEADGNVQRFSYDGERRPVEIVEAPNRPLAIEWGGYHKVCSRRDADGSVVRVLYNREGERVAVKNERGEAHQFIHSPGGLLTEERTFDGRTLKYKYDLAGQLVEYVNGAGERTELKYDLVGNLLERIYDDGTSETFTYDAHDDIVLAKGGASVVQLTRDASGQIVRELQDVGGEEHFVELGFALDGERSRLTTSRGHMETIERDAFGARRRTVLDGRHEIAHNADLFGRELATMLPGGGRIETAYDPLGEVTRRRAVNPALHRSVGRGEPELLGPRDPGTTIDKAYRYDEAREVAEVWDSTRGARRLQYDAVGRLLAVIDEAIGAQVPSAEERFSYDATGNRYAAHEKTEYGPGNRLLRKEGTAYAYDADGRLVEKRVARADATGDDVWKYGWSAAGRLASVTRPDGAVIEFSYDAIGRRVQKRLSVRRGIGVKPVATELTRFIWSGDALVHEVKTKVVSGAAAPRIEERTFCFEDDDDFTPWAQRDILPDDLGGELPSWHFFVNDPTGTPEELVGASGEVVCTLKRTAFGETTVAPGSRASTPLRFQGQFEDPETGLFYNRHRYYDPNIGRYISTDPIGLEGGLNAFAYGTNPISWVDPFGLRKGKKRGPKKKDPVTGRGGPHNDKIMDRIEEIQKEHPDWGYAGGGLLKEEVMPMAGVKRPKGAKKKKCIRFDITFVKPDGSFYRENVGLSDSSGKPVTRERNVQAYYENATGQKLPFTSYGVRKARKKKKK